MTDPDLELQLAIDCVISAMELQESGNKINDWPGVRRQFTSALGRYETYEEWRHEQDDHRGENA